MRPLCCYTDREESQPSHPRRIWSKPLPRSVQRSLENHDSSPRTLIRTTYPPQAKRLRTRHPRPVLPLDSTINSHFDNPQPSAECLNCVNSASNLFELESTSMSKAFESCCCGSCSSCTTMSFHASSSMYNHVGDGSDPLYGDPSLQAWQSQSPYFVSNLSAEPGGFSPADSVSFPDGAMTFNLEGQFSIIDMYEHDQVTNRNDSSTTYSSQSSSNVLSHVANNTPSPQSSITSLESSERPQFKCKHCSDSFTEKRNKNRHEETSCTLRAEEEKINARTECKMPNCKSSFARPDGLVKHITEVHKKCSRCLEISQQSVVFTSPDEIKAHKWTSHGVPLRT